MQLKPPLPRPGKILCCIANYWEHAQREARPLNMFMKNPDAVIGPGDTIVLPEYTVPWMFMHEAELAIVIKGPAKMVKAADWQIAVFGYTALIDVSAREQGRRTWPATPLTSWLGKSFDTFAPIGPCIVTADEIEDPNDLIVRFWNDGQLRHDYNTDDMEHRVPELVEFATTVMTMNSGDLIACGTNHEGLGSLQDGETVDIEIEKIGRMQLKVRDPLKRSWERGIYMGTGLDASGGGEAVSAAGLIFASALHGLVPRIRTAKPIVPTHSEIARNNKTAFIALKLERLRGFADRAGKRLRERGADEHAHVECGETAAGELGRIGASYLGVSETEVSR